MLVAYMFHDKSRDGQIDRRLDYQYGAGTQGNTNLEKATKLYVTNINGFYNLDDWQRMYGVNWIR